MLQASLLALHLLKSHTKAITRVATANCHLCGEGEGNGIQENKGELW